MSGPFLISDVSFQCESCGVTWNVHLDKILTNAQEIKAFLDSGAMGPCPRDCGGKTCSASFKLGLEKQPR